MRHRSGFSATAIRLLAWLVPAGAVWAACSNESDIGPGPVASIFLNPTSLTADVGLQGKIQAVALDKDRAELVGKQLTFVSDNPAIATVDDSGLVTAVAVSQVLGTLVFGVPVRDPATFAAVAVVLALVALAACAVPSLRASRVDPMVSLREE